MANRPEVAAQMKRREELWRLEREQRKAEERGSSGQPDHFKCPVCSVVMRGPDHRPIALSPCGHSVCESCLSEDQQATGRKKCCLCRAAFDRQAVNFALLSAIEGSPDNPADVQSGFADNLALAQSRLALFVSDLTTKRQQEQSVAATLETEVRVMNAIDEELAFVQEQHRLQHAKVELLRSKKEAIEAEVEKLRALVEPLQSKVNKLELLVAGSAPPS
jgi:hypothetical protein